MRALLSLGTTQLPRAGEVSLDATVLLFTAALAVVTGIVFGLAPGLTLVRGRVQDVLKEDGRGASASRRTSLTRHTLVIGEMALALVLLIGAALLLKSFARIQDVNPGFDSSNVLTAQIGMPRDPAAARLYFDELLRRVRALPGVTAASAVRNIPFSDSNATGSYGIVGYTPGPREPAPHGRINVVETDYFKVMGIPLKRGRLIEPGDTDKTPRVVVIDQFLADRYFKDSDPIGRQITPRRPHAGALDHRRHRRHDQRHQPRRSGREGDPLFPGEAGPAAAARARRQDRGRPADAGAAGARRAAAGRSRSAVV